jgi:aromatic ring-opening dioxygenase catalytic subunit (LigB family)
MLGQAEAGPVSEQFEQWLFESISQPDSAVRIQKLLTWDKAPSARQAHPQEDHLLPLMVAVGAAGESQGRRLFVDTVWGVTMASYRFGG